MRDSTIIPKKKLLSKKEKELYNQAVRDTLLEVRRYDGIITEARDRNYMVEVIQKKLSFKFFTPIKPQNE